MEIWKVGILIKIHSKGKIYACVAILQAVVEFASPLYNLIYVATLEWYLGFVYAILCVVLTMQLGMTSYMYVFMKIRNRKLQQSPKLTAKASFVKLEESAIR